MLFSYHSNMVRSWADRFPKGPFILIDESVVLYLADYQPEPWLGSRQVLALLPLKVSIFKLLLCSGSRQTANKKKNSKTFILGQTDNYYVKCQTMTLDPGDSECDWQV